MTTIDSGTPMMGVYLRWEAWVSAGLAPVACGVLAAVERGRYVIPAACFLLVWALAEVVVHLHIRRTLPQRVAERRRRTRAQFESGVPSPLAQARATAPTLLATVLSLVISLLLHAHRAAVFAGVLVAIALLPTILYTALYPLARRRARTRRSTEAGTGSDGPAGPTE